MAEVILKEDLKVSYPDLIAARPATALGYANRHYYDDLDPLCQKFKETVIKETAKEKEMKVRNETPYKCCVKRIIFNDPATIVFWKDGSKTVVKCIEGEKFVPYYGFLAALAKKVYGTNSEVNRIIKNAFYEKKEEPIVKTAIYNNPADSMPRDEKGHFVSYKELMNANSKKDKKSKKSKEHKKK